MRHKSGEEYKTISRVLKGSKSPVVSFIGKFNNIKMELSRLWFEMGESARRTTVSTATWALQEWTDGSHSLEKGM
jgi:hypothetical protein